MKHALRLLIALMFLLGVSSMASAYQATFYGYDGGPKVTINSDIARNSFFSNLVGVGTETFESYATGTGAPLAVNFGAAGTATLTGLGAIQSGDSTGRWAISGTKYWEAPGSSSSLFSIVFSAPVAAFGFYGTDIGDFDGQVVVTTLGGVSHTYTIPHPTGQENYAYTALYFGIIDTVDPFTSVVFSNTGSGADFFGFDNFSIGSIQQVVPTPEPITMLLLGLGVLGLAGLRKRD
jgi:hypothetical protein